MSEPAVKRSRVEMKPLGLEGLTPAQQLQKLCKEYEQVTKTPKEGGGYRLALRLTYRGVLARQGYLVQQSLGSGSYSKVKCVRGFNDKPELAAVKIIHRQKAPTDYQNKFMPREMKIWPELHHPNITRLYEMFTDSRRVYMVLEYAPGGDVLRYIQQHGSVRECAARAWTLQIGDAVRYMHMRDIAHRDLKLENLLLDARGDIKICDFGFVRTMSDQEGWTSHTYCGSRSYAAPEILQAQQYDPKAADIWAIGVILYIFVTGRMPFDETKGTKYILAAQKNMSISWARGTHVSSSCRFLATAMMTYNFRERPDIHEVMGSVWFSSSSELPTALPPTAHSSREFCALPPISPIPYQPGISHHTKNAVVRSVSESSTSRGRLRH